MTRDFGKSGSLLLLWQIDWIDYLWGNKMFQAVLMSPKNTKGSSVTTDTFIKKNFWKKLWAQKQLSLFKQLNLYIQVSMIAGLGENGKIFLLGVKICSTSSSQSRCAAQKFRNFLCYTHCAVISIKKYKMNIVECELKRIYVTSARMRISPVG